MKKLLAMFYFVEWTLDSEEKMCYNNNRRFLSPAVIHKLNRKENVFRAGLNSLLAVKSARCQHWRPIWFDSKTNSYSLDERRCVEILGKDVIWATFFKF